ARLHALAQALDAAEHRDRRRRRRRAAARRLGDRDGEHHLCRDPALRDRLRLDAPALLGARAPDQGQLPRRRSADAPGRARRPRDGTPDRPLLRGPRRGNPSAGRVRLRRTAVSGLRARARRRLRLARRAAPPRPDPAARRAPLPLLPPLPRAALRGVRPRRGSGLMDPELHRKNVRLGLFLFGLFLVLFAGTFAVALLYLALD